VESRLAKMTEWRSMNRVELIRYVEDEFGVKCTSKKHAIEFMEEREGNM
jgi:acyl carrier protein